MHEAKRRARRILTLASAGLTAVIGPWWIAAPGEFLDQTLGLNQQVLRVPWAWLAALVTAAAYSAYTIRAVPLVNQHKLELSAFKLIGVWAAVTSGIVEEIVFRQKLMDLLDAWGTHVVWQVAVSALVFGLAHASWALLRGELAIAAPVVAATTMLGLLLAVVYVLADRNVLPAIVAHILVNLVIEPWLILAAISGNWRTPEQAAGAGENASEPG